MNTQTGKPSGCKEALMFLVSGFLLLLAVGLAAYIIFDTRRSGVKPAPDDVREARQLLMGKFEGPSYFQCPAESGGFPYVSVVEARGQVPAVVRARKLPEEEARKLDRLIDKLAEGPKARLMSGDQLNILQLNLTLDVVYSEAP